MKILAAEFVTSAAAGPPAGSGPSRAPSRDGIPRDGLAQVAFAGRSNVGKSTLLNALVRKKIARTSAAPGKTRLANIYRLSMEGGVGGPGKWAAYLVDLPGYGYARGGADSAEELAAVAETYFGRLRHESDKGSVRGPVPRPEPDRGTGPFDRVATLLLVDSRHPGLDSDIQAHKWLSTVGPPPRIVATKVDKLSRAERVRNLRELERVFGTAALPVSATGGEGLDELWRLIASLARDVERPRK